MLRFTIRDVLWLTVVVGMGLGWWLLWRSFPIDAKVSGSIFIAGRPLADGYIYLHSTDGQIIGARVIKGQYHIHRAPVGVFRATVEGENVHSRYSGAMSGLSVVVNNGVNTFNFDLL
jgi:hypothetical protein